MTVSELIHLLESFDASTEVRIETTFKHDEPVTIRSVANHDSYIILRDHFLSHNLPTLFTDATGAQYEAVYR